MSELSDFQSLITQVHDEWNRAEADIKQAEQVCVAVIQPAINELRYAGRRLVDAIGLVNADGDRAQIEAFLNDSLFDCHRARHDAIDAATSKIAIDLETLAEKIGHDVVLMAFPDFPILFAEMESVREKIVASRKNRESREKIYTAIESVDFPKLVFMYNRMKSSELIMQKIARKRRIERTYSLVFGVIGVAGLAITIISWLFPRTP